MNLFVDTSALFAIMDAGDAKHRAAFGAWRALLVDRDPLRTTNYVVLETVTLVQKRLGLEAVRRLDLDRVFCFDP